MARTRSVAAERAAPGIIRWLPYPVTFALYDVFFYYAHNTQDAILSRFLWVACAAAGLALVAIGVSYTIVRSWRSAYLLAFLFVIYFFGYGYFYQWLRPLTSGHTDLTLFILGLVGLVTGAFWLRQVQIPEQVGFIISLASLFLLIFTLGQVGLTEQATLPFHYAGKNLRQTVLASAPNLVLPAQAPDVYYLIFDEYGGEKTLQDYYHFDDQPFLAALTDRHFYVAHDSTTNYSGTAQSLASSFNLDYVSAIEQSLQASTGATASLRELIDDNRVALTFKAAGYEYDQVGSWWSYTARNDNADHNFQSDYFPGSYILQLPVSIQAYIVDTTALAPIILRLSPDPQAEIAASQLATIPQIAATPSARPKFVFGHILLPHPPYVFDRYCHDIGTAGNAGRSQVEQYTDQVTCTNQLILKLVDSLIRQSPEPPVIILQGDEGQDTDDQLASLSSDANAPDKTYQKFPILNAYYFPDQNYSQLSQTITPVNSFRVVFDTYFGAKLPLLSDKNFLFGNYYRTSGYTDVTKTVQGAVRS